MSYRKSQKTLQQFSACALLLVAFFIGKGLPLSLAGGCGVPQFGGGGQTNVGVGLGPRSIATGDFNHDGREDLAVANYGTFQGAANGGISVLLNNGTSGYSAPKNLPTGVNPRSIATADFNQDGNPDLVVLNNIVGNCCVNGFASIFLGDGAGNFTAGSAPFAVGSDPNSMTVGDFNGDGKLDLAATLSSSVAVLLGDGAGGFGAATTSPVNGGGDSIAAGDINGDGKLDLVIGNHSGLTISVLLGNGTGAFSAPVKFSAGGIPVFVALGDLNQDSKLDVVVIDTLGSILILLGDGSGNFVGSPVTFNTGVFTDSVLVKDLNGDGRLDLAIANDTSNAITVLLGDGAGGFGNLRSYAVGGGAFFVTSGEFNGDGKLDLVTANVSTNSVTILNGDGAGRFGGARTFKVGQTPRSVASGDFNRDGNPDLVVLNSNQNSVSILLGDGSGNFGIDVKYPAGFDPQDVAVEDYNGDGKLDLAVANGTCCQIQQSVSILLGDGNGGFGAPTSFTTGTDAYGIVAGDFNKDGKPDLAVANNADYNISVLIGDGNGAFAAPVNFTLPNYSTPTGIAEGDFDGDGNTDLAVAANQIYVLMGNGAGGFSNGASIFVPGATAIAVGDINGDGKADLVSANSAGSPSVLLGDGSGGFTAASGSVPLASTNAIALGDFNGDGKVDLAATTGGLAASIFLGDGAGGFGQPTSFNIGGGPTDILARDLNGDGRLDLAASNSNLASYASVLLNTCSEAFVAPPGITISNASLPEGSNGQTNASFTVTLSAASAQTVTVSYYTIDQSAAAGSDYNSTSGHITFSPGTTSQTITVPILGDTNIEPDETFLVQLGDPLNADIVAGQGKATILNDDTSPALQFSSASYSAGEAAGTIAITVNRADSTGTATVDYATGDTAGLSACSQVNTGVASSRCDYATTTGTLRFAAGESSKTISIPLVDDGYVEGNESFTLKLSNSVGASLGANSTATVTITDNDTTASNPIVGVPYFVRQQYIDFLGREPDPGGFAAWQDILNKCAAGDISCDRINVSSGFFRSPEFQARGYFIYKFYSAGLGRKPFYAEFMPDLGRVSGFLTDAQLEVNKVAFVNEFMTRTEYTNRYGSLDNAAFVDALIQTAGLQSHPTRDTWITQLNNGSMTKATVLRAFTESAEVYQKFYNEAFVVMQYFGYLRRDPDASYLQWIQTMNANDGDYRAMISGFLNSNEYVQRFGP